MQLYLRVVLNSAVGFRGAAAALEAVSLLFPTDEQAPSPNGAQMWLLRLGLYMLSRPKEQADDWVWIIDHTIQIGPNKCLLIVGVRLSAWEAKRDNQDRSSALEHDDLSMWLLKPMAKSDAVKRELNKDAQWEAFLRDASHAKAKLRQTQLAFLLPPDNDELEAKMGWLRRYQEPLVSGSEMLEAVATVLTYVREHGNQASAKSELQVELKSFTVRPATPACRVAERLLQFVEQESRGAPDGRRFVGSSEVLESLIGKGKQLEGRQSKSGFTKSVLAMAASVTKITEETVHSALCAIKVQDVAVWVREHLGVSLQAIRHRALGPPCAEQNWHKQLAAR